jgi:predicted nucleotidyltransferase
MRKVSRSSAGAIYLDREARVDELRQAAGRAKERVPAVRRVILFGSLVSGIATPRSDADILIVLDHSPHERPGDRIPEMLRALSPLPCPIDLFVLTRTELDQCRLERSPTVRIALADGIDLLQG